jgi:hypothetical protein
VEKALPIRSILIVFFRYRHQLVLNMIFSAIKTPRNTQMDFVVLDTENLALKSGRRAEENYVAYAIENCEVSVELNTYNKKRD